MSSNYSEARAADRAKMAAELTDAAKAAGADVSHRDIDRRTIELRISCPGGAEIYVTFRGKNPVHRDVFVVTWNITHSERDRRFADIGDVNPYHRRKATRVARGFDALVTMLVADIQRFVDGSGYLPT